MEASRFATRTEKRMNREAKETLEHAEYLAKVYSNLDAKSYLKGAADTLFRLNYLTPIEYVMYTDAVNRSNY